MMSDGIKRIFCVMLSAIVLCSSIPLQAHAEERTLVISDEEAFLEFAKNCTLDSYSKELTVELTADLDLADTDFEGIPIFCGTFRGNEHTISGYNFIGKTSDTGFFRYVEEGAYIQDLSISGSMLPDGTKSAVGLFAGHNSGTLLRCKSIGEVSGDSDVGGLVGINEENGQIHNSSNTAFVRGNTRTGGIAGSNKGLIAGCTNHGEINIEENESATDTGGIVGKSEGIIRNSINSGNVGYQHTGYNSGGIAGRQDGIIISCQNHGTVKGRKDIGGIVGQFEPDSKLFYGSDPTEKLDDELARLSDLMLDLSEQAEQLGTNATNDLKTLNHAMENIRDEAHDTISEANTDTSKTVELVYNSAQEINRVFDNLLADLDVFLTDGNAALTDAGDAVSNIREVLDQGFGDMNEDLVDSWNSIDRCISKIESEIFNIEKAVGSIANDIRKVQNFLQTLESVKTDNSMTIQQKFEKLQSAAEALETIDIVNSIKRIRDAVEGIGEDVETMQKALNRSLNSLNDNAGDTWNMINHWSKQMEQAIQRFQDSWMLFSDASIDNLNLVNDEAYQIEFHLKNYSDAVSDKGQISLDTVNNQLEVIGDTIEKMADGASSSNTQIHGTIQDIIHQIRSVENALLGITETPEWSVDDRSDEEVTQKESDQMNEEISASDRGTVISCKNDGEITGDSNVGGIAGNVSPELSLDPEEDFDLNLEENKLLVDTTKVVRATVQNCTNKGNVAAKNDCAGGIVGRGEIGAVLNSLAICEVEATNGEHCGGIAGLSKNIIRSSSVRCTLTGNGKTGGIAGEGNTISDCYSMVRIIGDGEKQGAIAGALNGEISRNYFLSDELAGIDGVNYAERAVPLEYEAFASMEGVPHELLDLDVMFLADGVKIAVIPVTYGEALNPDKFPSVPEKENYYGEWENFDSSRIVTSLTIEAVYHDWIKTISSGEKKPRLLAEAFFTPDAVLSVTEWNGEGAAIPMGYQMMSGVEYHISDVITQPDSLTFRALAVEEQQKADAVAVWKDGNLQIVDSKKDGSYLIFEGEKDGKYLLLKKEVEMKNTIWGIAAAGILVLAGIIWEIKRKKTV